MRSNLLHKKIHFGIAYGKKLLDRFDSPKNIGSLDEGSESVGTGVVGAPACGDVMKLQVLIGDDGETINKAVFKVRKNFHELMVDVYGLDIWLCERNR